LSYFCCLLVDSAVTAVADGFTTRARVVAAVRFGYESTVNLTARLPNCIASRVDGVQMSILRPLIAPPVSATRYSPLHWPASKRTRVPRGKTLGSAAIKPRVTVWPLAVLPRRL